MTIPPITVMMNYWNLIFNIGVTPQYEVVVTIVFNFRTILKQIMGKLSKIKLTEIFMAKCRNDWNRCFHGTIRRETDDDGNPIVYGKIKVNDGYIYASAKDQWVLGEMLDEIVLHILNFGLHDDAGKTINLSGSSIFLN